MIVIRLARAGATNSPFYHVVVADKRKSRDGKYIERLGYYNPIASGKANKAELNMERLQYWQSVGAQPSERVFTLLRELQEKVKKKQKSVRKANKAKASANNDQPGETKDTAPAKE